MKKLFKRLYKTDVFRKVICWFITNYIRLVYYSSHRTIDIDPASLPYINGDKPAIFAFWHGRLLMMPMLCPPNRKMSVLISTHGDGEIIALAMHNFGLGTIRGSSTRGGSGAAIKAVKVLQAGENVAITPDGPRGPALQVQSGIITIAEMAGMPVIYGSYSASQFKLMRSWDRFMVVLPFGRIHYKVAAPLFNATKEELEINMIKITEEVDSRI